MAVVLGALADYYKYLFIEFQDPFTINYPLLSSPIPVAIIIVVYVKFVLTWGPKFMKNRKPFNLASIMMIYNAFQILLNLYMAITGLVSIMDREFSFKCQPVSYADTPFRRQITLLGYVYFWCKISDLLDTVFFVLRNKSSHISFLHVYHHSCMVIISYTYSKFVSGSHGILFGIINAFIHCLMYGYYFATIFKPEIKKSLRIKKHITQLQMVYNSILTKVVFSIGQLFETTTAIQFAITFVHFAIPLFMKDCKAPVVNLFLGTTQNLFMFALFSDFYIKTYLKKKPKN